jgi:hypothetical protein
MYLTFKKKKKKGQGRNGLSVHYKLLFLVDWLGSHVWLPLPILFGNS